MRRIRLRFWPIVIALLVAFVMMTSDITRSTAVAAAFAGAPPVGQDLPAEIRVQLGKSLLLSSQEPLKRVSVTNSEIANAIIVSPTQVLIHGLKAGTVTLILWDKQEGPRSFNLTVEIDITGLAQTIGEVFPKENIQVLASGGSVVLRGTVTSKAVSDRAAALAATQGVAVTNLLVPVEGRQTVLLQVRFAEVDRAKLQQAGLNIMMLPPAKTIFSTSTQQFGPPTLAGGGIGQNSGGFALTDLLNVFVFRPDLDLAVTIKALEQKNVLQILAEPNLLALDGHEASFLAGGEFPFPVLQATTTGTAITIQFREFGVRLNFIPQVMEDNSIRLSVAPEVSSLDFSNALTISGFVIPALSSRKAKTEVSLHDGQSFAIAGLIDNRVADISSKIPMLGDIPIIGNFFKSRSQNKTNTELMVMVTPRLVQPDTSSALPPGPTFPRPFLDPQKFDGHAAQPPVRKP